MSHVTVSGRLREARRATREDLAALAKRIGVREENLRAIEQGRLADLPPGIYGRAAIRSFAAACGFDPAAILAECESELIPVEEPISALGRLHRVRQPAAPPAPVAAGTLEAARSAPDARLAGSGGPRWRLLAAASVDACVVAALLVFVVVCAITAMMVPPAALDHSGPAFGVMGLLLGGAYFGWFGGLVGRTVGEQVLRVEPRNTARASITLRAIGARARLAATQDVRFIHRAGAWAGHVARQRFGGRSAAPPEPVPSAPGARPRMIGTTGAHEIRQKEKRGPYRIDRLIDDHPRDAALTSAAVVTAFRKVERVARAVPQR